jgi:hypothetical protein
MFLSLFYIIELQKGEWRPSYTQKIKIFVKHHIVTQKMHFWIDFWVYLKDICNSSIEVVYNIQTHVFFFKMLLLEMGSELL